VLPLLFQDKVESAAPQCYNQSQKQAKLIVFPREVNGGAKNGSRPGASFGAAGERQAAP
jgi:hypothetical protein